MSEQIPKLPSDQDASGRSFGDEELAAVTEVLRSGVLTSTKGRFVKELEERFAEQVGVRFAIAMSSGSAAVHAAVAAIDPEPGEEIVTTSITDMGALSPILYQGAIPVFADVDPVSLNVTARTIEDRLSDRTRAIIVTHLFGNPCEMAEIRTLAERRGIPLIEDCAQAFLARVGGENVGSLGAIGCFSLQQGKHISAGEGGLVVTDDEALARRVRLFVNKAWPYGESGPDHEFLALNYRMNELTGAVAGAQLGKLRPGVESRIARAARLTGVLHGVPGIGVPESASDAVHVYWRYALRVDATAIRGGPVGLAERLGAFGIASGPRYVQKPAFACRVFQEQRTFGRSRFPFDRARPEALDWRPELFPGTYAGLEQVLVLPWNERYEDAHVDALAKALVRAVGGELARVPGSRTRKSA
jgi:dTDP-4-amino-4,6-dideoxygalactose transaminase